MKILLAVDGSPYSEDAAEVVAETPWPAATIVRVLNAVEDVIPFATAFWYGPRNSLGYVQRQMTERAEQVCTRAVELLRVRGLKTEVVVREGDARSVIVDEAKEWPADLIVLGSHGHSTRRCLLRSIAQAVITHAPCSVEVVRRPLPERSPKMDPIVWGIQ